MRLRRWTIQFLVDGKVKDIEGINPTFWTRKAAEGCARRTTISHRNMYGDLYHHAGHTLEYRAVRR